MSTDVSIDPGNPRSGSTKPLILWRRRGSAEVHPFQSLNKQRSSKIFHKFFGRCQKELEQSPVIKLMAILDSLRGSGCDWRRLGNPPQAIVGVLLCTKT